VKKLFFVLAFAMVTACNPALATGMQHTDFNPGIQVSDQMPEITLLDLNSTAKGFAGVAELREKVEKFENFVDDSPIAGWILGKITAFFSSNPTAGIVLAILAALQVLLNPIANWTKNPKYNIAAILLNKLVQLLTFGSAKNQPDVLTSLEMVTNRPSKWPELIKEKSENHYLFG